MDGWPSRVARNIEAKRVSNWCWYNLSLVRISDRLVNNRSRYEQPTSAYTISQPARQWMNFDLFLFLHNERWTRKTTYVQYPWARKHIDRYTEPVMPNALASIFIFSIFVATAARVHVQFVSFTVYRIDVVDFFSICSSLRLHRLVAASKQWATAHNDWNNSKYYYWWCCCCFCCCCFY